MAASLGDLIYSRIGELARVSDDPVGLTRLYLSPAHKRAADLVVLRVRPAGPRGRFRPAAEVPRVVRPAVTEDARRLVDVTEAPGVDR
jgi:hypothetical protein